MDKLKLYQQIIENFKSMSLKDALKKEHVGTHTFNSLVAIFPEETKKYYKIRDEKRKSPRPSTKRTFSNEQMNNIVAMYKKGSSLQEIAAKYNSSPVVIKRNLINFGVPLRNYEEINKIQSEKMCPIKDDSTWEELYKAYLKDRSLCRVCSSYGTTPSVAIKNFNRLKLPLLKLSHNLKYETNFGVRYLYSDDWSDLFAYYESHSIKEVEVYFGIGRKRIYGIFKKLGFKKRSREEEKLFTKNKKGIVSFEELLEQLDEYEILEKFKGYTKNGKYLKYTFRHKTCGRTFKRTLHDLSNIRCVHCYPKSKVENLIYNLFKGTDAIQGDRSLIAPQELDCYVPSKKIAIEYNGRYWHNENVVPKKYHENKTEACLSKGVHLYHFWEGQNEKIIESRINQLLGKSTRIYARKTKVGFVDVEDRRKFFNSTHISGDVNCTFAIGLFYKGKLLSCMSFRKHKEGLEIARYSSELGTVVTGGFSKLLKFALSNVSTHYNVRKIVTYCNRDWTADYRDSVYYKNGFKFVGNTGLIMSYYNENTGKTESREKYQKHKLKKLFPEYNGENVNSFLKTKGILRMYNSGNWKFEKEIQ